MFTAAVLSTLAVTSASAQSRDPYFATASANYDFVYHETGSTSASGAHFDIASTVKRDVPFVGAVGEIGFNSLQGGTVSSFMGGPRLRFPNANATVLPFAQFLLGLYHCGICNINDFAIQGGGGLDFKAVPSGAIRIRAQVDFRHVFDDVQSFSPVRVSAGVVIPLNR
ncbi:MAG TPA: hypothetical protein VKD69_20385 [Vicinamibacterales bacterium]|nr:hypothetical protein [Vicinamibacterales bacterium]